ncbi:MAG: homoserine kinase, partial [Anaerolineae bacterium]|nr:homoserine kinase [Anaerolineae bacterium]
YSTQQAREALPTNVPLQHAVYNIGRAALVVDALRSGDLTLLGRVMADRLHQPYRLGLIPGAQAALEAARQAGAAAALSGAGPSVVAFAHNNAEAVAEKMSAAFNLQGINTRRMILSVTHLGAQTFPEQGEFSL